MADQDKGRFPWSKEHWVTLRRVVQVLAFFLFLLAFIKTRAPGSVGGDPGGWVKIPMQLDPLAMLAGSIATRKFLAGSSAALITILLTLLLGRVWCGWLCPLGSLLDWLPLKSWKQSPTSIPYAWRQIKYVLLFAILFSALLTNLSLLIFDPLTIFFRTLSAAVWPALDQGVTAGERLLYQVPGLQMAVGRVDALLRPDVLPISPLYYRYAFLYGAFFLSIIGLNLLAPRFYCRAICPLGALLGLLGKTSLIKLRIREACSGCGVCLPVCPTQAIREGEEEVTGDPGECILCMNCLTACPSSAVGFPAQLSFAEQQPYDPGRRQLLLGMGASLLGVGLISTSAGANRKHPRLIRPPGALEGRLTQRCVRCGTCISACPTGAIQPAIVEAGLEGLWTPILVPRLGYCDYSCHACGQICPVEAIPPLALEEKRQHVIGKAYLDHNRCLAWADNQECIVCEEMCPIPDKAIVLKTIAVEDPSGETIQVQRPYVTRELCIGCGICEYKCPVEGPAAIRVYVADA